MRRILDAHALMAFLEKEEGSEKVGDIFVDAMEKDSDLLMTTVNWGEVYYIVFREFGKDKADEIARIINTFPIKTVDVDLQISRQAAVFKAGNKLSYADCFAAALAKLTKGEVVTGDKEFKTLEDEVKICWIS
ncbi:MAG: type II toxin-antitoxin system VapC family toxin [Candidatus Saganbacteria bacterium]|nr:type II toxin-antitoxin system VapC family toxin [Candidatus Saganbacteria bacterium]